MFYIKNNFTKNKNTRALRSNGFTLVETLIALFIFTVTLTGLMSVASRGIKTARNARNSITAQFFAQEGIEAVHNKRDSYFLSLGGAGLAGDWDDIFPGCVDAVNPCTINYENQIFGFNLETCSDDCIIYKVTGGWLGPAKHVYTQAETWGTTVGESGLTRKVYIETVPGSDSVTPGEFREVTVEVIVGWQDGILHRELSIKENMTLWQ